LQHRRNADEIPISAASRCSTLRQRSTHHAPIARGFAVALTPQQRIHHFEKILRGRAFAGALAASLGRKTRESVQTDSLFETSLNVF